MALQKIALKPGINREGTAVTVRGVANHDVVALFTELFRQPLDLIHAVGFVVHRHDQCEFYSERRKHGRQINLGKIINEQVGGGGAAIHDHQIGFCQCVKKAVEFTSVAQIKKSRVGMKPFQRRIFVVAVNRDMGDALVFEELDEIDGKETFADAAFAVKDENQSFHYFVG